MSSAFEHSFGPMAVMSLAPNDEAMVRLVGALPCPGALLLEQNDEWGVQRARYMTLEPKSAKRSHCTDGRRCRHQTARSGILIKQARAKLHDDHQRRLHHSN
jgi:hypothetical protein